MEMSERAKKIWEEILQEEKEATVKLRDGEITVTMFKEQSGRSENSARDLLNKMVKEGKLEKRRLRGQAWAYCPVGLYKDGSAE